MLELPHPSLFVLLGGAGPPIFFMFTPIPGEMIQFDEHILQRGWFNHQLV